MEPLTWAETLFQSAQNFALRAGVLKHMAAGSTQAAGLAVGGTRAHLGLSREPGAVQAALPGTWAQAA